MVFLMFIFLTICKLTNLNDFKYLIPQLNSDAVRFSFGPLLQLQLDNFVSEWNSHRIRKSNMAEVPPGIPDVLFNFPELHGKKLYQKSKFKCFD